MDCLRIHLVRKKKIDGMRIDEFVENCDESKIYLLDMDPYFGKEMNFKVYRELSGIYNIWIDAAPRNVEDVMDILVSDADFAVITGVYFRDPLEELLEITENVAMRSIFKKYVDEFINAGGKIVILPRNMIKQVEAESRYVIGTREVCLWKG